MTDAQGAALWWERGADAWYYKDDWKGQVLSRGRAYVRTLDVPGGARGGWIVLWGGRGYALSVNGREVGKSVDGCLIDDFDLSPFLAGAPTRVTLRIDGPKVCAEGELIAADGKRIPFATGADWRTARGREPRTEKRAVEPSHGAFHRAHNGRPLTYNNEERGKTAIAKPLARIQRLNEQGVFLLRRLRPADEILSFEPDSPWRRAERVAEPLLAKARAILKSKAIPAQKAGRFADAIAAARDAANLITAAEEPVHTATELYRAGREITHLGNCEALILGKPKRPAPPPGDLIELEALLAAARRAHELHDWTSVRKTARRIHEAAEAVRKRLESAATKSVGRLVGGLGTLDEFPEDRFGWLNARELMGNDPARWPFSISPSACPHIDLTGHWQFRTDPNNEGEKAGWHKSENPGHGWRTLFAPKPWEWQGVRHDNLKSPADCPYRLGDARCGDKPYNGFAWYRKSVLVPAAWRGKAVILATGKIRNWARVFINGTPLGDGRRDPPATRTVTAKLLRFGKPNLIAVQVYNHDNLGGFDQGPLALYLDGFAPDLRETPGPLAYAQEHSFRTPSGPVRYTLLASAMSPAVVVATDGPTLELWGWEAKGHRPPAEAVFKADGKARTVTLKEGQEVVPDGTTLSERWLLVRSAERDVLIVLMAEPESVAWRRNALGASGLVIACGDAPSRAAVLVLPPGVKLNALSCFFWSQALRSYPVSASELVIAGKPTEAPSEQRCLIRYNYYYLQGAHEQARYALAPLPMLLSYGLTHGYPGIRVPVRQDTEYRSEHAPYRLVWAEDTLEYFAPAVDRSKVMKGVGELFAKREARHNMRGGVSEDEMFRRMGQWGFDHCRYAWAFHAKWDLPLVRFMGGPLIEDNEAMWTRLDELVDKCNAAGMQMMLCWFFNEDQPQADAGGAVRNSTRYWRARPETQKNAFELWRRIAARYADRPKWAISYDFFNEPAYMNTDHWNEIVKELTAVIRSVDKKHLIVWESADGWAQPFWCDWMRPADDPNVLYSFHHYGKHWGYAYDEYYPSTRRTREVSQLDHWLQAILFGIRHNVPIHCGEFGISMIQPAGDGEAWLNDYLALFERFGIGWNWWNYAGNNVYRTGLAAGDRISPHVPILRKWMARSGWGAARRRKDER